MSGRAFIDLDGVVVDFERYMRELDLTSEEVKRKPGAYLEMKPVEGAIAGVRSLVGMGFEVWIATKPPTAVPFAYADKVSWVLVHLPELKRRIIITHDKGLLGDEHDFLVDDRPQRANCYSFRGTLIHFGAPGAGNWPETVDVLRPHRPKRPPFVDTSGLPPISTTATPRGELHQPEGEPT
jgi:hypothetical protein